MSRVKIVDNGSPHKYATLSYLRINYTFRVLQNTLTKFQNHQQKPWNLTQYICIQFISFHFVKFDFFSVCSRFPPLFVSIAKSHLNLFLFCEKKSKSRFSNCFVQLLYNAALLGRNQVQICVFASQGAFFLVDFWDVAIRPLKCIYYICMYALVCPA